MKKVWIAFAAVVMVGFAFFTLPHEQRQAVAKYIVQCFILAGVIQVVGLNIGKFMSKFFNKD